MISFVYCLDENYNRQAITSINSLLNNVSEPINIFVIHNDPENFNAYAHIFKNIKVKSHRSYKIYS